VTLGVIATIPVGQVPGGVAVSPSGGRVYVTNAGDGTVSVIDTSTDTVVHTIPLGTGAVPQDVVVHPDGTRAYIACAGSAFDVRVIDTATHSVATAIPVGGAATAVAVSPDGTVLYVASDNDAGNGAVSVIDTATGSVTATLAVGAYPECIAVSRDGAHAYVTNLAAAGQGQVFDGTVSVIDTATSTVVTSIALASFGIGARPYRVAFSADGARAFVPVAGLEVGLVAVIDTATHSIVGSITVGPVPGGVAVSSDGTVLYVANYGDSTLSVIDTATEKVTATVVGGGPGPLALSADGTRIYAPNAFIDTVSVVAPLAQAAAPSRLADLVGRLLGGVSSDGGGWLVIGDHFYKIPPRPLTAVAIIRAAAPYLSVGVENRELGAQLRKSLGSTPRPR